jgi:hypothetical protein
MYIEPTYFLFSVMLHLSNYIILDGKENFILKHGIQDLVV